MPPSWDHTSEKKGGPGIFQASMRRQSQRQLLWKSAVDSEILCDLAVCFFLSLIQVNMISVIFFLVSLFTTGAWNCELPDEHPGPWPNSTMTHDDLRADSRDQSASQSPQRQDGRCREVQVVPETNSKFAPENWKVGICWNTNLSFGMAYFQGWTVSFREGSRWETRTSSIKSKEFNESMTMLDSWTLTGKTWEATLAMVEPQAGKDKLSTETPCFRKGKRNTLRPWSYIHLDCALHLEGF